jgi:hypothetical protein
MGIRFYIDNGDWVTEPNPEGYSQFVLFQRLQGDRKWMPPVYFGIHFFFINFI